jgi:hypothetical protein
MASVSLLTPSSTDCVDYLAGRMPDDAPRMGRGYAVENRYLGEILDDLDEEGFTDGFDYVVTE